MIVLALTICVATTCRVETVPVPPDVGIVQCMAGPGAMLAFAEMQADGRVSRDAVLRRWRCEVAR